jgi:hypothetical protein
MAISAIAATTLLLVIAPALITSAAAVWVDEKTEVTERCNDERFADRPSCPGASEDAGGKGVSDREDENHCVARNAGQAKDCPEDSDEIVIVNPQR